MRHFRRPMRSERESQLNQSLTTGRAVSHAGLSPLPAAAITRPLRYIVRHVLRWAVSRTITQRELRNESATVLREVEAGRTIIVTRNGTPVAELRPLRPHRFVPRGTIADAAARAPRVDASRFRADLNAVIDQRIDD